MQKFEIFVESCKKYINMLHLNNFFVTFEEQEDLEYGKGEIQFNSVEKLAIIRMDSEECDDPVRIAKHEVLELLLADISHELGQFVSQERIDELTHSVIHRLERVIE